MIDCSPAVLNGSANAIWTQLETGRSSSLTPCTVRGFCQSDHILWGLVRLSLLSDSEAQSARTAWSDIMTWWRARDVPLLLIIAENIMTPVGEHQNAALVDKLLWPIRRSSYLHYLTAVSHINLPALVRQFGLFFLIILNVKFNSVKHGFINFIKLRNNNDLSY